MTERFEVVIVGAGHGGAQTAIALRRNKFGGTIALVGAEPEMPYDRPSLSKEYLSGEKLFERMLMRPAAFWEERGVTLKLSTRIVAVDPDAHEVSLEDGQRIGYGQLVWATGGTPRRLTCAGHDLDGVHVVRSRADADGMLAGLDRSQRVVVIGGGYIGLEAAAMLSKFEKQVVVIEALDRVLARVASEPLSRFFEAEHRAHGVDVRLNAAVEAIEGQDGRVSGVRLKGGEVIPCEMVIVGIGILPVVGPLVDAGAEGGNGVAVDARCRTSLPDVFAVGDCALHSNPFANSTHIRLESVQNANDQAMTVAKVLSGLDATYEAVPWFWSNQYDIRLQSVGLSTGFDTLVVRGQVEARSFSVIYLREGKVIAMDCVNATKDYAQGRAVIISGAQIPVSMLADPALSLKEMLSAGKSDGKA